MKSIVAKIKEISGKELPCEILSVELRSNWNSGSRAIVSVVMHQRISAKDIPLGKRCTLFIEQDKESKATIKFQGIIVNSEWERGQENWNIWTFEIEDQLAATRLDSSQGWLSIKDKSSLKSCFNNVSVEWNVNNFPVYDIVIPPFNSTYEQLRCLSFGLRFLACANPQNRSILCEQDISALATYKEKLSYNPEASRAIGNYYSRLRSSQRAVQHQNLFSADLGCGKTMGRTQKKPGVKTDIRCAAGWNYYAIELFDKDRDHNGNNWSLDVYTFLAVGMRVKTDFSNKPLMVSSCEFGFDRTMQVLGFGSESSPQGVLKLSESHFKYSDYNSDFCGGFFTLRSKHQAGDWGEYWIANPVDYPDSKVSLWPGYGALHKDHIVNYPWHSGQVVYAVWHNFQLIGIQAMATSSHKVPDFYGWVSKNKGWKLSEEMVLTAPKVKIEGSEHIEISSQRVDFK